MDARSRREAQARFWGNPRVDAFNEAGGGKDPLRGMPPMEFPFCVRTDLWTDAAGEQWEIRWFCSDLQPRPTGEEMLAKVDVTFTTRIETHRLSSLGFDATRLGALASEGWNRIRAGFSLSFPTTLAALEAECGKRLSDARERIAKQYTPAEKAAALRNALRSGLRSRFA